MDAETIRHVHKELHPKKRGGSPTTRAPRTPQSPLFVHEGSSAHIKEEIEPPLRKQLQALATGSVKRLLGWLEEHGNPDPRPEPLPSAPVAKS
jgi:hypothetical protein